MLVNWGETGSDLILDLHKTIKHKCCVQSKKNKRLVISNLQRTFKALIISEFSFSQSKQFLMSETNQTYSN